MSKHTPGPWHVGERSSTTWHLSIYSKDGSEVAKVDVKSALHIQRRAMDATVMAAAPDLLAAVQAFIAYDDSASHDGFEFMALYNTAVEAARAAIAKATGSKHESA